MREALGKLIESVEALTKHASVGSPAHALIAEAKKLFVAGSEPDSPPSPGRRPQTTKERS